MTTSIYPEYKQAAKDISEASEIFFSDAELAAMLKSDLKTDAYRFAMMKLRDELLYQYGIDLIRAENEHDGKGYKIASDEERVEITTERLTKRIKNGATRQRRVLDTVDRSNLPDPIKDVYDRNIVRSGLLITFLHRIPLSRCLPGTQVRVDVPKLIDVA